MIGVKNKSRAGVDVAAVAVEANTAVSLGTTECTARDNHFTTGDTSLR